MFNMNETLFLVDKFYYKLYIIFMKKSFLILFFVILLVIPEASAKNIKLEALNDFSTANPPKYWQVKVVENVTLKNGFEICKGSIIEGKIEGVTDPKRLRRNANFSFIPEKFYNSCNNECVNIKENISAKYSSMSDMSVKKVAKSGAIFVGNQLANGLFGPGVAMLEGAIKNQEGNRAKSAVVSAYESTPLTYISKGKDIVIPKGQIFIMSFKYSDMEENNYKDEPNYTYDVE